MPRRLRSDRQRRHRLVASLDLAGLKTQLGIEWNRGKTGLKNNECDPLTAYALANGAQNTFASIKAHLFDTFGRSYVRGFAQGYDGAEGALKKPRNLADSDYLDGWEDGVDAATELGFYATRPPEIDLAALLRDATPESAERAALPYKPSLEAIRRPKDLR